MEYLREIAALLRIKECDLRLDALLQCDTSVDRGIHIGGAFSALTMMTALYYGKMLHFNVENPTDTEQDIFILSKGHAVAALASVYADVGYISREELKNSRGYGALIKGHPGPVIPGVPVATGPLGHGISIACGYAMVRKEKSRGNVFCMVGDGELQEGSCWEGILLAADRKLSNLCVIVDKNCGQSDDTHRLVVGMDDIETRFEGFGYRVLNVYAEEMESILNAIEQFVMKPQGCAPTAIICHSYKGFGGRSGITENHKTSFSKEEILVEIENQKRMRKRYVKNLEEWDLKLLCELAQDMGMEIKTNQKGEIIACERIISNVKTQKAQVRYKKLDYPDELLEPLNPEKKYNTYTVVKETMEIFARDEKLYTVDSDLSNASGMYEGVKKIDRMRSINVGIAECNMLCVAEALASEGANVWTSTFPPFFDQRALRRIAVSYQERREAIENGWLNKGHNLDITFLVTSANLETAVNGATHMGNDDMNLLDQIAGIKVIDVSCPQMLQAVMKWVAGGNRGLVYVRTMKTAIKPLYPSEFVFEYGKAYYLEEPQNPQAILVSSGHGVLEALKTAENLKRKGISIAVLDMPSEDKNTYKNLAGSSVPVIFAEQNNGALAQRFGRYVMEAQEKCEMKNFHAINTKDQKGNLQYVSSGTYEQLTEAFHLTPEKLEEYIVNILNVKEK